MSEAVHLIDASIYVFRAWFALPPRWTSASGMPSHAVVGFAGFLAELLAHAPQGRFFAAFDESLGTCFRHQIYPGYKQRRALPDEALAFQLQSCRELTRLLGICDAASPLYEADDLLASAAVHARAAGLRCLVLSRDKDLGQLLQCAGDALWDFPRGEVQDRDAWTVRHGIRPAQLAARLALTGDPIDDIPGVPGIGERTAVSLLQEYADIEDILADLPAIAVSPRRGARRTAAALLEHAQSLRVGRRLTALAEDALPEAPCFSRAAVDAQRLEDFGLRLGFDERLRLRLRRVGGVSA